MLNGIRDVVAALFVGMNCLAAAPAETALPGALASPDHGVTRNRVRAICYDRFGPGIGLTESFLERAAAEQLTAALRTQPRIHSPGAALSPADGVECVRETGPCRVQGHPNAELTVVLYESAGTGALGAEARAALDAEWRWLGTRYNNDTESRPADPARYTLRLQPDGSARVRADCNGAGGQYRLEGSRIGIEITHSTLAACEPGSLERVFLRDLAAAAVFFIKRGRLYLDLKYDGGTMEFERRP